MSLVKGINAGRLRHRVTILRFKKTRDELYNTVNVLEPYKTVWAEVRPMRGNEQVEYYKLMNTQAYKVTMRCTDVTVKDFLKFQGRQFSISGIADLMEDGRYLELTCTEDIDHDEPEDVDYGG